MEKDILIYMKTLKSMLSKSATIMNFFKFIGSFNTPETFIDDLFYGIVHGGPTELWGFSLTPFLCDRFNSNGTIYARPNRCL